MIWISETQITANLIGGGPGGVGWGRGVENLAQVGKVTGDEN